jgi:hypothetical protein
LAWYDDWTAKYVHTIDQTLISSGTEDYFPYLLDETIVPSEMIDADGVYHCQSDGGDIRVYSGNYAASHPATENTNRLPIEIETISLDNNPSLSKLQIWVRIPTLSASSDTDITIYYGATGKAQPAVGASYGQYEVWDDNGGADHFLSVWHLEEDPGPGGADDILDSTEYANHGTASSNMVSGDLVAAQVQNGIDFAGTGEEHIACGPAVPSSPYSLTAECWVNPDSYAAGTNPDWLDCCMVTNDAWGSGGRWFLGVHGNHRVNWEVRETDDNQRNCTGGSDVPLDDWSHIAGVVDAESTGILRSYLDGVQQYTNSDFQPADAPDYSGLDIWLGMTNQGDSTDFELDGTMDEARISTCVRSAPWLLATFRCADSPSTYATVGTPVHFAPTGAPITRQEFGQEVGQEIGQE